MSESQWEQFVRWAEVVAPNIDLGAHEHSYKREFAAHVAERRQSFLEGDSEWAGPMVTTLQHNNLLHWKTVQGIKEAAAQRPEALRQAVAVLWEPVDPSAEALTEFEAPLRAAIDGLSPGNVTAIGALLLMARDTELFPPYRADPVVTWSRLVGLDGPENSPGQRYGRLLDLCDELLRRGGSRLPVHTRLEAQGLAYAVVKWDADALNLPPDQTLELRRWRDEKVDDVPVDRGVGPAPVMEAAAWRVLEAGLLGKASVLLPDRPCAWTHGAASDLRGRLTEDPGDHIGGFLDKLIVQLSDAPKDTRLLAADLLYLQCAPLSNVTGKLKISRVQTLLSIIDPDADFPADLRAGLEAPGAFNGGQGFNAQIARHIYWLTAFVLEWVDREPDERRKALTTPMAFAAVAAEVSDGATVSIEPSLNYLAWPGHFSPVVSGAHRKRIRDAFAEQIGGASGTQPLDITQDLMLLRRKHEAEIGRFPEWYYPPYREVWDPAGEPSQRAWLVRPNPGHQPLVGRWLNEGFVSLKAEHLGSVSPGSDRAAVQVAVDSGYQHIDYAQRAALTTEYHAFLSRMREDDLVATLVEGRLYVGTLTGEPTYHADAMGRLKRGVDWNQMGHNLQGLPVSVTPLLDAQGTVVDITAALPQLAELIADDPVEPVAPMEVPAVGVPRLPTVMDEIAQSLHMPKAQLQELMDVLQARQQVVLYGPPGTGKTFVARALASHIVGEEDASRARLVQFHPSYSYEDFFEGYRPTLTSTGQAGFELKPGPLRQLASEATNVENQGAPFVLIIDEMNRANLAKVFGELYFLLEYRNETVRLQYSSGDTFRLPPNLFIIGTMNTADRSIAMVDAAIRRRFAFIEMHPSDEPVKGVLERFLGEGSQDKRARILAALNTEIGGEDRDLQIGPSYLMRDEAATPDGLAQIWRFDILPLLEEHYYGRLDRDEIHRRFGLEQLRRSLEAADRGPSTPDHGEADGVEVTAVE